MNIKILILLFVSAIASGQNPIFFPSVASGYTPPPPAGTDLAEVHYLFENNEADSSGNALDADVTSMAYGSTNPAEGSYYGHFVSTSTLFGIPTSFTSTSPFSVSCWARQENTGGYYRIMSPYHTNSGWEYWQFWLDGVAYDLEFRGYQNSTGTLDRAGTANSEWSAGTDWMHIVFTYSNGTVTIYLDGANITTTGTTWSTSDMKLDITLYIGQHFDGDIDDFSLYSFVLSSTQVTTLYNSGVAGTILSE